MIHRKVASLVIGSAMALGLVAVSATAAQATVITAYQGADYASLDTNYSGYNSYWVEVCDMEQDGNGVYAIFYGPGYSTTRRDGNGSAGGCNNERVSLAVTEFKVCEDQFGTDPCSSWTKFRD